MKIALIIVSCVLAIVIAFGGILYVGKNSELAGLEERCATLGAQCAALEEFWGDKLVADADWKGVPYRDLTQEAFAAEIARVGTEGITLALP